MRFVKWTAGLFLLFVVLAFAAVFFSGFNVLRGPITRMVTEKTGRELRIEGDLRPVWSWIHPRVRAEGVSFANPRWAKQKYLLQADAVEASISVLPLFAGRFVFPDVVLSRPRVALEEETPGLQILEMDTARGDGPVHTTRSVRVCRPYSGIVYKQGVLPALLSLHLGQWIIEERAGAGVSVTSRHTVRVDTARIADVLGPDAGVPAAYEAARTALSGNSLITLRAAKAYAEGAGGRRTAS